MPCSLVIFVFFCYNMYMLVDFDFKALTGKTVAVALSGGSDSMALLHYLTRIAPNFDIKVKAINVEHGIRGASSIADSAFAKDTCDKLGIPLLSYSVDSVAYSKERKLSLEEGARALRYGCFFDAIKKGECDFVATAHHLKDQAESILLNVFRGSGIKGLTGIKNRDGIIRPFLSTPKKDIEEYIKQNAIPYVTDQTNFDEDYTRNYLRQKVLPVIEKVFPNFEASLLRLSAIASEDDEYIELQAQKSVNVVSNDKAEIELPLEKAPFSRAVILALKSIGIKKDWEKKHIDDAFNLSQNQTGRKIDFPFGVLVVKEYDRLVFTKKDVKNECSIPFSLGKIEFLDSVYTISAKGEENADFKSGNYFDLDKLPLGAIIRTKKDGDIFKAVNGKTKNLSDFLCEKKIPLLDRTTLPLIAKDNTVYAILGVAIAEQIRIDETTKKIAKIT